jgi:hypothetical protein
MSALHVLSSAFISISGNTLIDIRVNRVKSRRKSSPSGKNISCDGSLSSREDATFVDPPALVFNSSGLQFGIETAT